MRYALLADLIVAVHAAYVGFTVLGQLVILTGAALKWEWIRNFWFRLAHLAAIGIVALEAVFGMPCPLTVWEDTLRDWAGQEVAQESFIGRWLHQVIFYDFPGWAFTTCYVGFALIVLATFLYVPPRWPRRSVNKETPPPHARRPRTVA